MAGIPMYHGIPSFGEVEAKMAREKMDVLKTEEAQIKMDSLKDKIELFKTMNRSQNVVPPTIVPSNVPPVAYTPAQEPQVMSGNTAIRTMEIPQEMPTPVAIPVPKTAADGTPMPSFMSGTKAEAEGKKVAEPTPTEEPKADTVAGYQEPTSTAATPAVSSQVQTQTKQEVPKTTIIDDLKSSSQQVNSDEKEMAFAYKFAEELRRRGNLLGWEEATKKANDLRASVLDNQNKYLTVQDKFLDITSGIAYGYTQAVKDNPTDQKVSDQAWATMLMTLQSKGIPVEGLFRITDPSLRLQKANQYMNSALGGKEQIRLTIAENNNKIKEEANRIREAHYKNQDSLKLQEQAFNQSKFNAVNAQALLKASQSNINNLRNNITNYSNKEIRDQLRVELTAAEKDHQELVKRLRLKANDDGVKWSPNTLVTKEDLKPGATKKEEPAPAAESAPSTETKSGNVATGGVFKGLSEEEALRQTKEHLQSNPNNKAQAEKLFKESFPNSTFNLEAGSAEPKKTAEETTKEKKLKRIAEIEAKLNAPSLKLTESKGLGLYGQLKAGASTLAVGERRELEAELKRLKSEVA